MKEDFNFLPINLNLNRFLYQVDGFRLRADNEIY